MEMKEIQSIALSQMPNGNHIEFNTESYEIITGQEAVAQEFAPQIGPWKEAIDEEDRVMEKVSFSELTKRIADADKDRDTLYEMFMRIVRAYLGYTEAPKREAAEKIDRYDRVNKVETGQQYDRETGNMENLIQDMRQYCAAEVELLGLTAVLGQMDEKNRLVRQLLLERNEQYVDSKHIAVKDARRVTDERYELLRKFINASALLKGVAPYSRVIDLMNQNIERTKLQVFKKTGQTGVDGGATPGEEGAEGGSGSTEEGGSGSTGSGSGSTGSGEPTNPSEPSNPGNGGGEGGNEPTVPGGSVAGGNGSNETPTDPTKILLLFNDGAHGNVILKRMEVEPGYQLQASDLPDGYVYAFKADDQADIDAATPGEAVWVTLSPRS